MNTSRFGLCVLAVAILVVADVASADQVTRGGYVRDSQGTVVRSGFGLCWHTGFWRPDMAIEECDTGIAKVAEVESQPSVAITLKSVALFEFDESVISAEGMKKLDDEVIGKMKEYSQIELVLVTGHADRIGTDAYNQRLSQRRADAVKNYLVEQGVDAARIETAAKGESEPDVACDEVSGEESGLNRELVDCLLRNRRVVVEIKAQNPV